MKRPPHLERTHNRLLDWASWVIRHPHGISLLGVQVADLTAVRSHMPAKSLVPHDLMPGIIGAIDAVIHDPDTPRTHKITIIQKYLEERAVSEKVPRHKHRQALEYMCGRLAAAKKT